MKFLKLFVLSIFVSGSLFLSVPLVQAATSAVTLATVNIININIVSKNDNIFDISFSLTNRTGVQAGVKYGVLLMGTDPKNQIVVDEKVYPESLTLVPDSNIPIKVTYEAPKMLSGDYNLYIVSRNESGFPFGKVLVKKVTLKSTTLGLEIIPSSCYLQVIGEKNSPHYDLLQKVDISKDEKLTLTCSVLNSTTKSLTVIPTFETLFRTAYGAIIPQTGGSTEAITVAPKEQKIFSVTLPIASSPQVYNVNVKLSQGDVISNTVSATYTLRGEGATIINIFLDKDSYKKGDKALISFMYDPLSGNINSRVNTANTLTNFVVKATVVNDKDQECITPINQTLVQNVSNPKTDISATITRDCLNPKIAVTLSDDKGNILDQKDFSVISNANSSQSQAQTPATKNSNRTNIIILIVALVVVGAALFFINLKKKSNETNTQ
jgi:hypothetical protein